MSEIRPAAEMAEYLEAFAAEQRKSALDASRLQKIVFVRQIGEGMLTFEAVIDEKASADEIYEMISRPEMACDRLKAKVDLTGHYSRILNNVSQIEMARRKLAEMTVDIDARRAAASINRRELVPMADADKAAQRQQRDSIKDCFEKIEETQKAIEECKRILGGDDPFQVLADQIAERLDQVRGSRGAVAA